LVPAGVLDWVDRMAHQLTPQVLQHLAAAGFAHTPVQLLGVWQNLVMGRFARIPSADLTVMGIKPGVVHLVLRLAAQPWRTSTPDAAARCAQLEQVVVSCLDTISCLFASLVAGNRKMARLRWGPPHKTSSTNTDTTTTTTTSSSSSLSIAGQLSSEQIAAVHEVQVSARLVVCGKTRLMTWQQISLLIESTAWTVLCCLHMLW
jgi:hypothetical protein